jgi:hypothetical protein
VTSPIWGCASSNLDEVVHLKIYQIECSRFEKYSDPKYNKHKNFTVSRFISQQYKIQQAPQNPADTVYCSVSSMTTSSSTWPMTSLNMNCS